MPHPEPKRDGGTPLGDMISLVELIREPTLARIYTHVRRSGASTVATIAEELDVPERTVYDYVDTLDDAGFLHATTDTRPVKYAASDIELTLQTDDDVREITPAFVEAIARRDIDDDIDVYVEKHGVDGLATALDYAREYVDGTVNHRIMARELDISPLEASIILQALRDVVEDTREE